MPSYFFLIHLCSYSISPEFIILSNHWYVKYYPYYKIDSEIKIYFFANFIYVPVCSGWMIARQKAGSHRLPLWEIRSLWIRQPDRRPRSSHRPSERKEAVWIHGLHGGIVHRRRPWSLCRRSVTCDLRRQNRQGEAAIQTTSIGSVSGNIAVTIGIKMPNVPQEVPVAKASPLPTRNNIAGKSEVAVILPESMLLTKRRLLILYCRNRLTSRPEQGSRIAETIILNPCGIHSANSLNVITRRGRYSKNTKTNVMKEPITSPMDASQFAKALMKLSPSKNPPV